MLNTNTLDTSLTRPIKRGKQGERTVRPNNEKSLNDDNFVIGKFKALVKHKDAGENIL